MIAKVLKRKQTKIKNKELSLDITKIKKISAALLPLVLVAVLNMGFKSHLTNASRENYSLKLDIQKLEKEIDVIKSELILTTNVSNIQKESESKGFVYNENLGYIK